MRVSDGVSGHLHKHSTTVVLSVRRFVLNQSCVSYSKFAPTDIPSSLSFTFVCKD